MEYYIIRVEDETYKEFWLSKDSETLHPFLTRDRDQASKFRNYDMAVQVGEFYKFDSWRVDLW